MFASNFKSVDLQMMVHSQEVQNLLGPLSLLCHVNGDRMTGQYFLHKRPQVNSFLKFWHQYYSIADLQIHLQTGLRSDQSLQLIRRIKAFQPLWHSCANSWRRESSRNHNITPSAMKTESLWSVLNRYSNIHHLKYFAPYSMPYCRLNFIRLDSPNHMPRSSHAVFDN